MTLGNLISDENCQKHERNDRICPWSYPQIQCGVAQYHETQHGQSKAPDKMRANSSPPPCSIDPFPAFRKTEPGENANPNQGQTSTNEEVSKQKLEYIEVFSDDNARRLSIQVGCLEWLESVSVKDCPEYHNLNTLDFLCWIFAGRVGIPNDIKRFQDLYHGFICNSLGEWSVDECIIDCLIQRGKHKCCIVVPSQNLIEVGEGARLQKFNNVSPTHELAGSLGEEHESEMEREVQKGPDLLSYRTKMMLWDIVKIEIIDEILELNKFLAQDGE